MSKFWNNTLPLLKQKGLKQADIVSVTNNAKSTISEWIKKDRLPNADDAVKIADLLGVSVRYLCTGEQEGELTALQQKLLKSCEGLSDPMMMKVISEAVDLKIMMHREKGEASRDLSVSGLR